MMQLFGNGRLTVTFSKTGELLRLFYPEPDFKQFFEWMKMSVKVNDSLNIYLHDDINNTYMQRYVPNTNVLQTEIFNTYFNLRVLQTDFVPINGNILVRNYLIKNENSNDLQIKMLADSKLLSNINNDTSGFVKYNSLIQYNHDYTLSIFSNNDLYSYQINNVQDSIWTGNIGGKDYIGLSNNSAISYDLGVLHPNDEVRFSLVFMVDETDLNNLPKQIEEIKKIDINDLYTNTVEYWKDFVNKHDRLNIINSKLNEKIKEIYIRTILLYPLLQNSKTGGMSAGVEIDEWKTKCGRYSYCWPRDSVFITKAQDIIGMEEETSKFYSEFCKMTQSEDGRWEQRFYTDGKLAPSWGYQIDETAAVIVGLYEHYLRIKDVDFLKKNVAMIQKAIEYLKLYVDDLLSKKFSFQKSYDLWEEYEGVSLYSLSNIYAAFKAAIKLNAVILPINGRENEKLDNYSLKLKQYILENFFDEELKTFVRNKDDSRIDISILGPCVPFGMLDSNSREMSNTVQKMEMTIRTYTGGFLRYENDTYIGGNPWVISTLWMALYYIEDGQKEKALECFNFVVNTSCDHGFLAEQIDNVTLKPKWVIGLSWSHAMFIIVLEKLLEKGML